MNKWRLIILFSIFIISITTFQLIVNRSKSMKITKRHILKSPLIVYSNSSKSYIGILPKGTSMRYIKSFDEGFDRFEVYVNVERFPLALEKIDPPDIEDPLFALPKEEISNDYSEINLDDLQNLLLSLGVKKDDLVRLCKTYEME